MGTIVETPVWVDEIYQLETTDVVVGGDPSTGGTANVQAQQLAKRTAYLKKMVGGFDSVFEVTNGGVYSYEMLSDKLLMASPSVNNITNMKVTVGIEGVTAGEMPAGFRLYLMVKGNNALGVKKAVEFELKNGSTVCTILGQGSLYGNLFLHEGEVATLLYLGANTFQILSTSVDFNSVGSIDYKAGIIANGGVIAAMGQILNRRDFPRLWALAADTAISDATWQSNINNSGRFSTGNGSSTFRMPDLRGVFVRGLDLGRGLDPARSYDSGVYVPDSTKPHMHKMADKRGTVKIENPNNIPINERGVVTLVSIPTANDYYSNIDTNTQNNAGTETTPKSTAYITYIKY